MVVLTAGGRREDDMVSCRSRASVASSRRSDAMSQGGRSAASLGTRSAASIPRSVAGSGAGSVAGSDMSSVAPSWTRHAPPGESKPWNFDALPLYHKTNDYGRGHAAALASGGGPVTRSAG